VADLRLRPGPRPVRHVSEDGRLLHSISVQDICRRAESSTADLQAILADCPASRFPSTGHASPAHVRRHLYSLLTMNPAALHRRSHRGMRVRVLP
jgi:hypothetical protein